MGSTSPSGANVPLTTFLSADGSQGWDMVPHRDFWADLPYVLRDLVTSRRNTGGYAAI